MHNLSSMHESPALQLGLCEQSGVSYDLQISHNAFPKTARCSTSFAFAMWKAGVNIFSIAVVCLVLVPRHVFVQS